jgi:hypothetical protein
VRDGSRVPRFSLMAIPAAHLRGGHGAVSILLHDPRRGSPVAHNALIIAVRECVHFSWLHLFASLANGEHDQSKTQHQDDADETDHPQT